MNLLARLDHHRVGRFTEIIPVGRVEPVPEHVSSDPGRRLGDAPTDGLPVTDAAGVYRGTVSTQQVEEAMRENALDARAGDLAQDLPALQAGQTLEQALSALLRARSGLPVASETDSKPVGWLTHMDILRAYNSRLQQGIDQAQQQQGIPTNPHQPGRISSTLARLRGYRIVDLELATTGPPVGQQIADLPWPPRSTILALRRGNNAFEPDPSERLDQGDRLTVLVPAAAADDLTDLLTADRQSASGPRLKASPIA